MAKKAEHDKKFKKAYLLGAVANAIRLTNDLFALYNLCQNDDENLYKWTKVMWIGQDFVSLLSKVKLMASSDLNKWEKVEFDGKKKINLMLSDFLKKLDVYILPSLEEAASVILALDSYKEDDLNSSLSLLLQAVISGSRLLSDMIEAEFGSTEQKFIIASSIVHAVLLLKDLFRQTDAQSAQVADPDLAQDAGSGQDAEPVVEYERSDDAPIELTQISEGNLGLVRVGGRMYSARIMAMHAKDYSKYFGKSRQKKLKEMAAGVPRHDE